MCCDLYGWQWGLHILNFSIDPPDILSDSVPEDLSYNEIESVVELVLEEGLGIENAIPESDEVDNPDGQKFVITNLIFYYEQIAEVRFQPAIEQNYRNKADDILHIYSVYDAPSLNLLSPPPEA